MAHMAIRMEVNEFAERFIPIPPGILLEGRLKWPTDIFAELAEGGTLLESEIAKRFVDAINVYNVSPGMKMVSSPDKPELDDVEDFKQKIDAAFFRDGSVPTDGRTHWADQLVSVEFKRHETNKDPFDDRNDYSIEATADERKKVRGQIITYAEVVFRVQHRTFLFMLLVIGRNFRLLRWDRSGTIVTRAIDYVAHPEILCELLWRMSLQTDEQLGLDPSATRLLPQDHGYKLMDFYAQERDSDLATEERVLEATELASMGDPPVFKYVRLSFRTSLQGQWPRYRLEVPCDDGVRAFLVCKPHFYANGMAGRGTRGYVALDCRTQRFVWLKDAWRVYYEAMMQEGEVLHGLNAKHVAHIPTLLCHGDVRDQTTKTCDIWEEAQAATQQSLPSSPSLRTIPLSSSATLVSPQPFKTSSSRKRSRTEVEAEDSDGSEEFTLRRHMHYRIVVNEVALPLSEFSTGRKLVSVIIDCVEAHRDAVQRAKIMHRDISGGNILIYPSIDCGKPKQALCVIWKGILCDWEMSKSTKVEEPLALPRQPPRTGTWQFLSVGMLSGKPKAVEIPDELESFVHVLLYYAVRYLRSNCPNGAGFLDTYFDAYTVQNGVFTCGQKKESTLKDALLEIQRDVPLEFASPLDDVFGELLPLFKAYYKVVTYEHVESEAKKMLPPPIVAQGPPKADGDSPPPPAFLEDRDPSELANLKSLLAPHRKKKRKVRSLKPTAEEEDDAALLADHDAMLSILAGAVDSLEWSPRDKVGDLVPDDHKPLYPVAPEKGPSVRTVKRRRFASMIDYGSCHSSDFVAPSKRAAKSMVERQ
ncbi:hypothetical protein BN946_scf184332.g6 [Trametes cinnabarina]|uniref:Fungal-type protein kinase domain-containing protein n=1 Tax=Pycnoporus cinnabarinus TaxID=5643 RepID=A0A060SPM7_PYCCI|nr:hypothetical protein BN946_scf184332.g6 [Trametes cinnabarina]